VAPDNFSRPDASFSRPDASNGHLDGLERFLLAQEGGVHEQALAEVRAGRKAGHWMWFVYPQLRGLGRSEVSRFYGIVSLDEARAYIAHPILGPRIRDAAAAALAAPAGASAEAIFGPIDALKLRSSMTLFMRAVPEEPLFPAVLARFFRGSPDAATDRLLAGSPGAGS
jgi:uncharacterized protein (DUF1810 family)